MEKVSDKPYIYCQFKWGDVPKDLKIPKEIDNLPRNIRRKVKRLWVEYYRNGRHELGPLTNMYNKLKDKNAALEMRVEKLSKELKLAKSALEKKIKNRVSSKLPKNPDYLSFEIDDEVRISEEIEDLIGKKQ